MLSQAAARPPGAAPAQGLLGSGGGGGSIGGDGLLAGFARSGSSNGLGQPPPTQLQLQQELLGGPSTGPSPAGSLSNTPRTLSSGLATGAPQPGAGGDPTLLAAGLGGPGGGGGKGWSSLDGISRPNWQQQLGSTGAPGGAGGNPSDAILGAGIPRPPSTGPSNPLGAMHSLSQSFDGSLSRGGPSPNPLQGLQGLPPHLQQQGPPRGPTPQGLHSLPNGLPSGASTAQQQLLQQHLAAQQRAQAGLAPSGYAPAQQQQQQATSIANLQAAAQAAQAAQAAAIRQQALLRNALQGQQQHNLGSLSQQNAALLQHAIQQQQQQQQAAAGLQLQQQQNAALLQQQQLLNQANALTRAAQGLTAAQQNQLLQGQINNLALQQQINLNQAAAAAAAGMRPGGAGLGGAGGINPALAAALLGGGGNAAAQQLQVLQQQAQGLQNQAAAQQQQQLLLSQALRANGLQAAGLGQRPPSQLQSEALIAMQRQQAALQAQGLRMPQHGGGVAGTGLSAEQLLQLQQLGLLSKPAPPVAPPIAPGGSMTAQQQAALLSALQAGGQHKGLPPNLTAAGLQLQQAQQQQQQRAQGPPGLANGAAFLGQAQQAAAAQMQRGPPLGQQQLQQLQQQQQQQQVQQANLLAALGGQRPPLPPQVQAQAAAQQQQRAPAVMPGAGLPGLGGRPGSDGQSDPIQTLQDIGKTLAQLNITVEAAVNAGLLGGLSASDVKIVAEAHRAEMEAGRAGTPGAQQQGGPGPGGAPLGGPGSVPSRPGSHGAPTPRSPASPAHSHASAAAAALGGGGVGQPGGHAQHAASAHTPSSGQNSTTGGEDDDFPLDSDEASSAAAKQPIDEAALRAKVEQMSAQFDATQYGFFASGAAPTGVDDGLLLSELEQEGGRPAGAGGAGGETGAGGGSELPTRAKSDPGAEASGEGESYHLWGGAMLPDELESKLTLADPVAGSGGRVSAPPSVVGGTVQPAPGAAAAAGQQQPQQPQAQQPGDLASLWGNAQGDRSDPFGSYLAGLRLGTGF